MIDHTFKGTGVSHTALQTSEYADTKTVLTPDIVARYQRRGRSRKILWRQALLDSQQAGKPDSEVNLKSVYAAAFRPMFCGQKSDKSNSYEIRPDGHGGTSVVNVMKCGDSWCCPVCSETIRQQRAQEIREALRRHHASKGTFVYVTMTVNHNKTTPLPVVSRTLCDSTHRLTNVHMWRQRLSELNASGYIETPEITLSPKGMWQTATHLLLFIDGTPDDDTLSDFHTLANKYWADTVSAVSRKAKHPMTTPDITLRKVGIYGSFAPLYLSRFEGETVEQPNFSPFTLLDTNCPLPLSVREREAKWVEYVTAMNNRPPVIWTPGLKRKHSIPVAVDRDIILNGNSYTAVTGRFAPVETTDHVYECPNGHRTILQFAQDAEDIPPVWECRCGQTATQDGATMPTGDGQPKRTPFDMLMERRPENELQETLEKRLQMHRDGYLPDYE